jgi:hypothetical protein
MFHVVEDLADSIGCCRLSTTEDGEARARNALVRGPQPRQELWPSCSVGCVTIIAEGNPQRLGMLHHLEAAYLLQAGVNS